MAWPPGTLARAPTIADVPAVRTLLCSIEQHDIGELRTDAELIAASWRAPFFDLARDACLLHASGELVGYAAVMDGRALGRIAPHARGRGLGSAMLRWIEARASEQACGAADARVGQTVPDSACSAIALLLAHGYAPAFASWVLRLPATSALPSAAPPAGFVLRALRAGEERGVFALIDAAFSEWPGRKGTTFDAWRSTWLARSDFDPGLFLVAENERGELAGALHAIQLPTEGWIQQLAVAPAYRQRGLARALLATSFTELLRRGAPCIGLNTDSRTGALGLYTRLGMTVALSFTNYSKPLK